MENNIIDIKPQSQAALTQAVFTDNGLTYNEPGISYNEPGVTYGGSDPTQQVQCPGNGIITTIQPVNSFINTIL